jgi:SAM-dependent methyltransferase
MNRFSLLVELRWHTDAASHTDRFHLPGAEPDAFPQDFAEALNGLQQGQSRTVMLSPGCSVPERVPEMVQEVDPGRFRGLVIAGRPIRPRVGRFYPSPLFSGSRDPRPCRCILVEAERLTFDCNHPLAGKEIECTVTRTGTTDHVPAGLPAPWMAVLDGPGMQDRYRGMPTEFFSDEPFRRQDESEDSSFYQAPRLVDHVDVRARGLLRKIYSRLLERGCSVLDLMSSHQSHLPPGLDPGDVVGLGLNMEELESNPALTRRLVHDLNRDPALPFDDRRFDAILCSLSVEYLARPLEVFAEAARVLRPGGILACTFSNRWFHGKAISLWVELHEFERMGLVAEYFHSTGRFQGVSTISERGWTRLPDPADRYFGRLPHADPVYGVYAGKKDG